MLQFDLPKERSSIIKVIGVGGGGSNAVTHMFNKGIKGVNFVICNTDAQALEGSAVPNKVQLGPGLTDGRGAGSNPSVGREATLESLDDIKEYLASNTKMVFITAGMGGGTGTGGAPIIAKAARELGLLTVGIVTSPFTFEGRRRLDYADEGMAEMRKFVDTLLVISNDKLREICGNLSLSNAFEKADDVLCAAAKGIAEIITVPGYVNVDFEDVKTVMQNSGVAIMGSSTAEGENRANQVVQNALASPLLNDNNIAGANHILVNIASGLDNEVTMDEISEITDYIQSEAGNNADVIWGNCYDEELGAKIALTIIATGFNGKKNNESIANHKVVRSLDDMPREEEQHTQVTRPALNESEPELKSNEAEVINEDDTESVEAENQFTFSFDMGAFDVEEEGNKQIETSQNESTSNLSDKATYDTPNNAKTPPATPAEPNVPNNNEPLNSSERMNRLRNLSMKMKNPTVITEMENIPAYKRKQIELDDTPHSSDASELSRFNLPNEDINDIADDDKPQMRENNSFLHDNVD